MFFFYVDFKGYIGRFKGLQGCLFYEFCKYQRLSIVDEEGINLYFIRCGREGSQLFGLDYMYVYLVEVEN